MFKEIDPLLNSPLRLGILSILVNEKEAEFNLLKEKTKASAGNLSVQINKLKIAEYIEVIKHFKDNYPQTICKITSKGTSAFKNYEDALQSYFKPKEE
jgi:hypothetical protein